MGVDIVKDKKPRRRKGVVKPDERWGDISSVRIDGDPMSQTNFGDLDQPLAAPEKRMGDALVDKGTEAPKPRLSSAEMRMPTPTAAGGVL